MRRAEGLPQEWRLATAAVYALALFPLSFFVSGSFVPPPGTKGLWFGVAIAGLAIGKLLQEPRFTSPAAGVANGIALVSAAVALNPSDTVIAPWLATLARAAIGGYGVLALGLASIAILKRNEPPVGRLWFRIAATLGQAALANTIALFALTFLGYADSPSRLVAIQWSWLAAVVGEPLERIVMFQLSRKVDAKGETGRIHRVEDPGLAVAAFPRGTKLRLGQFVTLGTPEVEGRIVETSTILDIPEARIHVIGNTALGQGDAVALGISTDEQVVGHVAENSDLEEVLLEITPSAHDRGLEEERLAIVRIGGADVMYQVISAEIRDESVDGRHRSLVRVGARKLGTWNSEERRFDVVPWLPAPDTAAVLVEKATAAFDSDAIGHIPGTQMAVGIDIDAAVTHNTAILGILGVGKTTLSYELIRRMAALGIKVIVLDITGHYSSELALLRGEIDETKTTERINAATKANAEKMEFRDGEAGSLPDLRTELSKLISEFLDDGARAVLIVNPNSLKATRMEGFPRYGKAEQLAPLTAVEVTRVVAEVILAIAEERDPKRTAEEKKAQKARYCVVLEEAHSLVPEYNSVTSKVEEHAVAGTVRALLQGRKYGFGALVVTQRTANVTKSVLNQCNTVFAMRVFDNTGMDFLANYIGKSYSKLLSVLRDHHAVFFGRGSRSRAPIVIELNHPDDATPSLEKRVANRLSKPAIAADQVPL